MTTYSNEAVLEALRRAQYRQVPWARRPGVFQYLRALGLMDTVRQRTVAPAPGFHAPVDIAVLTERGRAEFARLAHDERLLDLDSAAHERLRRRDSRRAAYRRARSPALGSGALALALFPGRFERLAVSPLLRVHPPHCTALASRVWRARMPPSSCATARQKKARIARIRAYRNYYCHAVLMALNQTGATRGGSRSFNCDCEYALPEYAQAQRRHGAATHAPTPPNGGASDPARGALRPRAHIAGDIAAQVSARRWRREIAVACFALLPGFDGGRLIRLPVPACWRCWASAGAAIDETTMPHRSSDIGLMLSSRQADRFKACLHTSYGMPSRRKHAVSNSKWMFHQQLSRCFRRLKQRAGRLGVTGRDDCVGRAEERCP